jgi:hypothetical protein
MPSDKKRKFIFADPIVFQCYAGKPGSQLFMYFSQYDSQEDIVTLSLL